MEVDVAEAAVGSMTIVFIVVVEFGPDDYAPLDRPTAVDGNVILRRSLSEMAELVERKKMAYHPDLPAGLFERIRAAVLASPVVDDEDKDLVRGYSG